MSLENNFFLHIYLQLRFVVCILYNKWMREKCADRLPTQRTMLSSANWSSMLRRVLLHTYCRQWRRRSVGITGGGRGGWGTGGPGPPLQLSAPLIGEKNRRHGAVCGPPNRPATQWNQSHKSRGGTTLKNLARHAPYSGIWGSGGHRSQYQLHESVRSFMTLFLFEVSFLFRRCGIQIHDFTFSCFFIGNYS